MNALAQRENARSLSAAIGSTEEQAAELLNITVAVTFDETNPDVADCAKHIYALLRRTIHNVKLNLGNGADQVTVEIVIGCAIPRFPVRHVFVVVANENVAISFHPLPSPWNMMHRVSALLAACYAVAAALKVALGDLLPIQVPGIIQLNLAELFEPDLSFLNEPVLFDETYLAGAGAIGNGFAYGLSQFDARGELHIADDDKVSAGNLQRCLFFEEEHLDALKAEVLSAAITTILPTIKAVPHPVRIQDLPARFSGPWLKRLVVGVDSPRARRSLQCEIPGEVFDASTTGISEIVFHFQKQPTSNACLACAYPHNPQEDAHEVHIAEALGVPLAEVHQTRISESAARAICRRYTQFSQSELVGVAYDTLFKQLCSTAKLQTAEDRQVLAPFAFVSVLAGTFLAIEFVRRIRHGHEGLFNEWRISPWSSPVLRRQRVLERNPSCEFCGNKVLSNVARDMWGEYRRTPISPMVVHA